MIRFKLLAALGVCLLLCVATGQSQDKTGKIAMTPVSYEGLKQEVLKHRGKVVIVDFWGSFCLPCIKDGFPHMKELHKKLGNQGLAIITVSVDREEDKIELANKILNRVDAPFRHVQLNDTIDWTERFKIEGVPCYYVFDRNGRWVRFGGGKTYNYDDIDKTVVQMLNEK